MALLSNLFGYYISQVIMPSQSFLKKLLAKIPNVSNQNTSSYKITQGFVDSTQGAKINFCEVVSKPIPTIKKNQKIIIHLQGNGDIYENHIAEYIQEAKKYPGVKIVGFNSRNVRKSTGLPKSQEDWVDDAIALIRHYQKKGSKLEDIILSGHSLGAAILTMAGAKIYQEEKKIAAQSNGKKKAQSVKIINNRSFSTLADEVLESILGGVGSAIVCGFIYGTLFASFFSLIPALIGSLALVGLGKIFPNIPKILLRPITVGVLKLTFGTMDALSAYKSLPNDSKTHIVAKDDLNIVLKASLHYGLKPINSKIKKTLREQIAETEKAIKQTSKKNKKAKLINKMAFLKDELFNLKDSKLRYSQEPASNMAHNCNLSYLRTYHKLRQQSDTSALPKQITGEEVMENKLKRFLA